MTFFTEQVAPGLMAVEQGYVNDPHDPGGETIWGVTARLARQYGYAGAMRDMTKAKALDILEQEFFIRTGLNSVATAAPPVAIKLCDIAVNMGPSWAGIFLQTALNAMNRRGKDYPDLKVDGQIGPGTVTALRAYMKARPATSQMVLLTAIRGQQTARYLGISQANPDTEDFIYGWLLRAQGV